MAQIQVKLHVAAGLPDSSIGSNPEVVTISQTVTLGDDMTWDPLDPIAIPGTDVDGFIYLYLAFESDVNTRLELADWTVEPLVKIEELKDPNAIGRFRA